MLLVRESHMPPRKVHRYLASSTLLMACCMLYMHTEVVNPGLPYLPFFRIILAIVGIAFYSFVGLQVAAAIRQKISGTIEGVQAPVVPEQVPAPAFQPIQSQPSPVAAQEVVPEPEDEEDEDIDKNETDDEGNPIPSPSEDNLEDLIFFQKLEAIMAKKKLFNDPDITREQVASEIGTNRTYLIRSIKLATGKTFKEYLTDLRVNYAAMLLTTTDEPLDDIGTIAGFGSRSAYYRAFSAANNCSPREYRNRKS